MSEDNQRPKVLSAKEILLLPPNNGSMFDSIKDSDVAEQAKDRAKLAMEYYEPQHKQIKRSLRLHSNNCWLEGAYSRRIAKRRPAVIANILTPIKEKVLAEHLMQNFSVDVVPRDEDGADFSVVGQEKAERRYVGLKGERFNEAQFLTGLVNGVFSRGDVAMHFNRVMRWCLDAGYGGYLRMYTDWVDQLNNVVDIRFTSNQDPWSWLMDPECREPDFSDMNFFMDCRVMTKKTAQRFYGKKKAFDEARDIYGQQEYKREPSKYMNHPDDKMVKVVEYFDRRKKRVKFVKVRNADGSMGFVKADEWQHIADEEMRMGNVAIGETSNDFWQVAHYLLAGGEVIQKAKILPEWDEIPVFPMTGLSYIDGKGRERYRGLLDPAEDLQHLLNYNYSAWAELTAKSSKTTYQYAGDPNDVERISKAMENNELIVPVKPGSGIVPIQPPAIDANLVNMINSAPQMIKEVIGLSAASLGQRTNETSQRGIQARKAESDVGLRIFSYQAQLVIRRMARMVVKALPLVYDGTRQVVIVANDGERTPVLVNSSEEIVDEQTGMTVTKVDNDVTQPANVDFIVKPVIKDTDSRAEEAVRNIIEIVKTTGQGEQIVPLVLKYLLQNVGGPGAGSVIRKLTDTIIPDDALSEEELNRKYETMAKLQNSLAQLKQMHQIQDPPPPPEIQKMMLEVQKAELDVQIAQATLQNRQADAGIDAQLKQMDLSKKQLEIDGVTAANAGKEASARKTMADVAKAQGDLKVAREQASAKLRELNAKGQQDQGLMKEQIKAEIARDLSALFDNPQFSELIRNTISDQER